MKYLSFFLLFLCLYCKNPEETNPGLIEAPSKAAAQSIDGKDLFPMKETAVSKQKKDSLLNIAIQNLEQDSNNLNNIIWYGRRLAYLSRYDEAIAVYTKGLHKFPESPELFRHRGHRYISIRAFDKAISDFEKAAYLVKGRAIEIEPDGLPNKLNIPLSSLQFNIWYHWALAYYLKGDFSSASQLYETCMEYSTNSDLLCATTDWLYMTYRRLGQTKKAKQILEPITKDLEIIENTSYFNRLLMYKGQKAVEDLINFENKDPEARLDIVTQGYGVGNFYLYNGDTTTAENTFKQLLESDYWSAFGYIAAEVDLYRLNNF